LLSTFYAARAAYGISEWPSYNKRLLYADLTAWIFYNSVLFFRPMCCRIHRLPQASTSHIRILK